MSNAKNKNKNKSILMYVNFENIITFRNTVTYLSWLCTYSNSIMFFE